MPRWARLLVGAGAGAAAALVLVLFLAGVPVRHALLLPLLLVLLPVIGVAQAPLVEELGPEDRISLYATSGATILLLGGIAVLVGLSGPGPEAMGLTLPPGTNAIGPTLRPGTEASGPTPTPAATFLIATLVLVAIAGVILALFHLGARLLGHREPPYLEILLPRTRKERTAFALLSVAAGTGEEAAFRAYGVATIAALTGSPALAVGVTSLSFGLLHGYQGPVGVVRTASLGAVFALSLLWSGSVLPAMAAHTLVDWVVGLWLGDHLLEASGPTPPSAT